MFDTMDHSDAIADSLAMARQAMLERAGITVTEFMAYDTLRHTPYRAYIVAQDGQALKLFTLSSLAYTFADELIEEPE